VKLVRLSNAAREDISRDVAYGDGNEAGAVLFGYIIEERGHVEIVEVAPNRTAPDDPHTVRIEVERYLSFDRDNHRIIGDLHSHEMTYHGLRAEPSKADIASWRNCANTVKHPWVGIILSARRQTWDGGYPHLDWVHPKLDAWVAEPGGGVREIGLIVEPLWLADLEKQLKIKED